MIGNVLQFRDLQELCRPGKKPRLSTVEDWARERNIKYSYDGRGGIWTTQEAMNEALGIGMAANDDQRPYGNEIV